MHRSVCAVALLFLVGVLVHAADETYTIKIKTNPAEGHSLKCVSKLSGTYKVKVTDEDGKVLKEEDKTETKEDVYTDKILKAGKQRPTKYQRTYEKARETKDKKTTASPYQGRTILFEMDGGKYKVSAVGKPELSEKVLQKLAKEANKEPGAEQALFPKKPVKVGGTYRQRQGSAEGPVRQADRRRQIEGHGQAGEGLQEERQTVGRDGFQAPRRPVEEEGER